MKRFENFFLAIYYDLNNINNRLIFSDRLQEDEEFGWWGSLLAEFWQRYIITKSLDIELYETDEIPSYLFLWPQYVDVPITNRILIEVAEDLKLIGINGNKLLGTVL